MSTPVIIGLAAVFFVLGILFIIKRASSEEEGAIPISSPKEIAELKSSFIPSGEKGSPSLSKVIGEASRGGPNNQSEMDELNQKNEQLKESIEALKKENQRIKNSQLEKIKTVEESIAAIQKENERLLPNHQLIDELKVKGESFEKRCVENKAQQQELRELIRILESENDELVKSQKFGIDQSEFKVFNTRLEIAIASIESLKGENRDLQRLNQDLKNDFEKTKEHNARLTEKESIMEYELSKNRAQNLGLEKICEDFKEQIENLTTTALDK